MIKQPSQTPHAAAGIVSLVVLLATLAVLPPIPAFGSSENEVVTFYATHTTSGYVYQFMAGLALLAALWFLGYAYTRFRREVPGSPLPVIMLAAGTAWATFAIVSLGLFQIFSVWAAEPEAHGILKAFSDAYVLAFAFNSFPAAVMIGAGSWCTRSAAGWPGWLKKLGMVALAAQVLASVPLIVPDGALKPGGLITYGPFFLALLWIFMSSLAATRWERSGAGSNSPAGAEPNHEVRPTVLAQER
ncbi:hypothetical protein ACFC1R_22675 [Kitasatospora sp. NPDC056138]|uniref:hypothetical protein n=1 Tax=Kitasatospora sp. NPDC056138 TaxID=3345724 RepID=UPI0035D622FD